MVLLPGAGLHKFSPAYRASLAWPGWLPYWALMLLLVVETAMYLDMTPKGFGPQRFRNTTNRTAFRRGPGGVHEARTKNWGTAPPAPVNDSLKCTDPKGDSSAY